MDENKVEDVKLADSKEDAKSDDQFGTNVDIPDADGGMKLGTAPTAPTTYASTAITGKGATLGYSATSGGSPTYIMELTEITFGEISVGNVDATHYQSPNNFVEKKSVIWQDVSDMTATCHYLQAQTTAVMAIVGVAEYWTALFPDGAYYTFPGYVSKYLGTPVPNKDLITQKVSITVTGPLAYTA